MGSRLRGTSIRVVLAIVATSLALLAAAPAASALTYTNPMPITIPAGAPTTAYGPASPYPSPIVVAGVPGTVLKVRATLNGVSHTAPSDIDTLLVGPGGQKTVLMSSACGGTASPLTGQTFTFDDAAAMSLPLNAFCPSGTYKPSKNAYDPIFPGPAPSGPQTTTSMSVFNGGPASGTWQLFVFDHTLGDVGSIAGGWSLELTTTTPPAAAVPCAGQNATISGTEGADTLRGTPGDDVIAGLGGNDKISGLSGKDTICGGDGNDKLKGGDGNDKLLGQKGKDTLKGGPGKDKLKGGPGKDKLLQ